MIPSPIATGDDISATWLPFDGIFQKKTKKSLQELLLILGKNSTRRELCKKEAEGFSFCSAEPLSILSKEASSNSCPGCPLQLGSYVVCPVDALGRAECGFYTVTLT